MKKAKIYIPTKTAMQSGRGKNKKWVLEFETKDPTINPLMGWESSEDTMGEVRLEFSTKDKAIDFAKKNNINFNIIEPKKRKFVIKSYADNFTKN
ncbi:MAG: hypothetical protein CBE47_01600 [Pelagibacteraceae bacterium TMED287]|nr:MAG: hypothetical protein CBE47_01600 [Pelagibacteraceae bacterium TMED287]